MSNNVFELGPIRPTSEAASLLVRVTRGCAWNKCRFCNNYRTETFSLRPLEDLKREIDIMASYRDRVLKHVDASGQFDMDAVNDEYRTLNADERQCYSMLFNWIRYGEYSVFLQDADAMILKAPELSEVIRYLKKQLPEVTRVTSYGRPDTLGRITPEGYAELKEAGLNRIHAGFETGSDIVLKRIMKGCTSEQQIIGGRNVMDAGIELSVFLMAGVGGKKLSDHNADETARVINAVNPSFVRLRTAVVIVGTPLWDDLQSGMFDECTDMEQFLEMRRFLTKVENCTGSVYTDHMINLMTELQGPLTDTAALIAYMDEFLAQDKHDIRRYQLAKRLGFNGTWKQMHLLSQKDSDMIDDYCNKIPEGPEWEKVLKDCLRRYI